MANTVRRNGVARTIVLLAVSLCVPAFAGPLDIGGINIVTEYELVDGVEVDLHPWDFEIEVTFVDIGAVDHVDVFKPGEASSSATFAGSGLEWEFDPDDRATLALLRDDWPEGIYRLEFCRNDNEVVRSVSLDYSGLAEPTSAVDYTYPSVNNQTGISTNPTFTWTVAPGAGDVLAMGVDDLVADDTVYFLAPAPLTMDSWSPGPLLPSHPHDLNVDVSTIKDWTGSGLPTMTVGSDTFAYGLIFTYFNEIAFVTGPSSALDDVRALLIQAREAIQALPPEDMKKGNPALALSNKINAILAQLDKGLYDEALNKLQNDVLKKPDGCAAQGEPDRTDWLLTCEAQRKVYPLLARAVALLEEMTDDS